MGEAAKHPGGANLRARAWLRRAAAALASTAMLGALVQLPGAEPALADTATAAATISIDSLSPAVPTGHDTLKISGTVTNTSDEAMTDAHVALRVAPGGPLTNRSEISDTQISGGFDPSTDGAEVPGHTASLANLPAHATRPFALDVPVTALSFGADGVYQLSISASGDTRSWGYPHVLGITRTFLPWYQPRRAGQKTGATFLWPLIDRPHLETRTSGDSQQTPLFRDDDLARELAPGGRLEEMVTLAKGLPVTWVIDPDLLATVDAMTKPYQVDGPGGDTTHTRPGTGTTYARQWLNQLQQEVQGAEVVALPFGDPDIASIAHHAANVSGTIAHLRDATDLAGSTVQTVLGVTPETDFAWPVGGAIDRPIVGVATAAGADNIIASSDSLRDSGGLSYTPSAARPIGGGTTAVVADAGLSGAFSSDVASSHASTLAVQRFLAQSLMINEQAPQRQRSIVIAPPRTPTVSQAHAMAQAISATVSGGWTQPESLESAAKQPPDPAANRTVPSASAYPASLRGQELSTDAFQQIQSVQDSLNSFLVILSRKDRVTIPFGTAVLRSMSTEWRGDADGAAAFRDDVSAYLTDLTQAVRIVSKQPITLSGRGATIPVTVQNGLAQEVTGLQVRLTSSQPNRLQVGPPQPVDIGAGHNRSFKFTTKASANGRAWVTAQLYTQDGTPYGQPMVFQVNVTSITATVMLVIGGGLLLLVLAGVRMYRQRKRLAERRSAAGDDQQGDGDAEAEPVAAGEQPGDRPADTTPQSPEPPAAGEKVER